MNSLELITKAIKERKPISFQYNKSGKVSGERIGNPHAIFVQKLKDGSQSEKVDIYRTSGVTSTPEKPLPDWRMYFLKNIKDVSIIDENGEFEIAEGYKPESPRYEFAIEKV